MRSERRRVVGTVVVVVMGTGAGTAGCRHESEHRTTVHEGASSRARVSPSPSASSTAAAGGGDGWTRGPMRSSAFPGRYTQLTVRGRWATTHSDRIEQASAITRTTLSSVGFKLPGGYRIEYAGIVPENRRGPLLRNLRMLGAPSTIRLVDVAGTHVRLAVKLPAGTELAPAFPAGVTRLSGPTEDPGGLTEFEYLGPKLTTAQLEQLRANIAKAAHQSPAAVLTRP